MAWDLKQRVVLLAVLSSLASRALPSACAEARVPAGVVGGAFTQVGWNPSSAPVAVAWTTPVDADSEFTDRLLGETHLENSTQDKSKLIAEGVPPPVETPNETRVPEPSTLALLGSGIIALAGAARSKWRFRMKVAARLSPALPGEA